MFKTGVIGAGHLGKIHINILKEVDFTELIGFYDTNPQTREEVASLYGIKAYENLEELIENCDIVDVVTPTLSHYECAKKALQATKHVFIEKPVTQTLEESKSLVKLVEEAGTKVQVGHVERFNPAFKKAIKHIDNPLFIETHRLAQFNPRGTDVSVVLDLMIHDIDIVLSVVDSPVNNIQASGVSIASKTPDIANARIEFSNGCVANLTASRFSMKKMRKSRFFQKNAYVSVDFLKKNFEVIQMKDITDPDPLIPTIDLGELGKKQ
jgi:predicted dehydrogenase